MKRKRIRIENALLNKARQIKVDAKLKKEKENFNVPEMIKTYDCNEKVFLNKIFVENVSSTKNVYKVNENKFLPGNETFFQSRAFQSKQTKNNSPVKLSNQIVQISKSNETEIKEIENQEKGNSTSYKCTIPIRIIPLQESDKQILDTSQQSLFR